MADKPHETKVEEHLIAAVAAPDGNDPYHYDLTGVGVTQPEQDPIPNTAYVYPLGETDETDAEFGEETVADYWASTYIVQAAIKPVIDEPFSHAMNRVVQDIRKALAAAGNTDGEGVCLYQKVRIGEVFKALPSSPKEIPTVFVKLVVERERID